MIAEQAMRRSLPSLAVGSVRSGVDKIELLFWRFRVGSGAANATLPSLDFPRSNILGDVDFEGEKGLTRGRLRASFD